MNYLSLFSGAGGGDLGALLLGWTCLGYVEQNEYCCKVLEQRINDGIFEDAPIFQGDIREWIKRGYAASYQGMVDVVTAGFPCQGWSTAASGRNKRKHDLWPETFEVIQLVKPGKVMLENVQKQAIERASADLYDMGYACKGIKLEAADMGADHKRARYWLCAYPYNKSKLLCQEHDEMEIMPKLCPSVWQAAPGNRRVSNGAANRVDRFKAVGNGQVPAVVRAAWQLLNESQD